MLRFFNIINAVFVAVTIIAHLLNYTVKQYEGYGITFQFFLGSFQLLFAVVLMTWYCKKFDAFSKRLIAYYWLAVAGFIGLLFLLRIANDAITVAFVIYVVPMLIACYQVYAIHKIIMNNNSARL